MTEENKNEVGAESIQPNEQNVDQKTTDFSSNTGELAQSPGPTPTEEGNTGNELTDEVKKGEGTGAEEAINDGGPDKTQEGLNQGEALSNTNGNVSPGITQEGDSVMIDPNHSVNPNLVLIDDIKELRKSLDFMIQLAKRTFGDQSLISQNIFLSKCWLGKVLGELGNDDPYVTKLRPKSKNEIPKTADTYDDPVRLREFENGNLLDKVYILREKIGLNIVTLDRLYLKEREVKNPRLAAIALTNTYNRLSEARFWLGDMLAKIRES